MPRTDWDDRPEKKKEKPAPRFGACLVCGQEKCGCWEDDLFGPQRDKLNPNDANAEQPMLRLFPQEGDTDDEHNS